MGKDFLGTCPEKIFHQNFWVRSDFKKSSIFHWFPYPHPQKNYGARVPTIFMPPTFPIASLNRYTPNFSGVPQKLTWCQQFGLQIFPKWGDAHILPQKNAVFRCFFWLNKFSRPNSWLSPIACHTSYIWKAMTLSHNLAYPTRRQIFAGKQYSTFWNIWDLPIHNWLKYNISRG